MDKESDKVQFFSDDTGNFYQLYKYKDNFSATLKINGVPMHRFTSMDPMEDTRLKILSAKPYGDVLDTCMGLGYTAISSALLDKVRSVTVVEIDPEVVNIAKLNELSYQLFNNPKIKLKSGDSAEVIKGFDDCSYDTVIHDPPTFTIAPQLYHLDFYRDLYRVLKKHGRLWHYAPQPGKLKGKNDKFTQGLIRKLKDAGFQSVKFDSKSSGIIGFK